MYRLYVLLIFIDV